MKASHGMTAMARRNPVTKRVWWIAGLSAVAAAGVATIAYVVTRPGQKVVVPVVFKHGERYQVVVTAPAGTPNPGTLPTQASMQAALDAMAPGEFSVAQVSYTASPPTFTMTIDVVGPTFARPPVPANVQQQIVSLNLSIVITDVGPSPSGPTTPAPTGPTLPVITPPAIPGTPITDPVTVTTYQGELAAILAVGIGPLASLAYGLTDVSGNPQDPKFVAALIGFQIWVNAGGAAGTGLSSAGLPINNVGVLDSSTGSALAWVSTHLSSV